MRDELHLMELVDRYLDGGMGDAERAAFEERLRSRGELRVAVDDQYALREGLQRAQLRNALASAHRRWTIQRWAPWLAAALVMVAASAWMMRSPMEHEAHPDVPQEETIGTPKAMGPDNILASDPLMYAMEMRTRVESVFMRVATPNDVDTSRGEGRIVTRLITDEGVVVAPEHDEPAVPAPAISAETRASTSDEWKTGEPHSRTAKADSLTASSTKPTEDRSLLATVEIPANASKPIYPGGMEEMQRFIHDYLKQPVGSKRSVVVTVWFTVNKKGEVTNVEVVKSMGRVFDAEAIRVVSSLPLWRPARIGDRPVKSKVKVPVRFSGGAVPREKRTKAQPMVK